MILKVIVTGAFSTGKTTLVDALEPALRARGLGVVRLPDVARSCPFPLNAGQTDATSVWLVTTQISRELSAVADRPDIILCDRGIPDVLAHQEDLGESGRGVALESMRAFLEDWCTTYDVVLASGVDEDLPPMADGLRKADPAYRARLGRCSDLVLARMGTVHRLLNGPAERIAQALDAILT